jgi:hypothetical protein
MTIRRIPVEEAERIKSQFRKPAMLVDRFDIEALDESHALFRRNEAGTGAFGAVQGEHPDLGSTTIFEKPGEAYIETDTWSNDWGDAPVPGARLGDEDEP